MARTARLSYPGGVFHVVSRCVGGSFLLDHPQVRDAYVSLLGRSVQRTDARVLAYCVMSNHAHVVLVQGQDPLARIFKPLHTGIAWHANRHRNGRAAKGPVMAQRPRSVLVQEDAHLLELVRNVHNNPVRAGVVRRAEQSSWSSHRAYLGVEECPTWLHAGYVLEHFGRGKQRARDRFNVFVREGAREARRSDLSGDGLERAMQTARQTLGDGVRVADGVLGDAEFLERVSRDVCRVEGAMGGGALQRRLGDPACAQASIDEVIQAVCEAVGVERLSLETGAQARDLVMTRRLVTWVWVSRYGGRQVQVASALRSSTSAVARWYGAAREVIEDLDSLADAVVHRVNRARPRRDRSAGLRVRYDVAVEL